jgi:hypothetical protein
MTLINERVYEYFPKMQEAFKAFGMGRSPPHSSSPHLETWVTCGLSCGEQYAYECPFNLI